MKLETGQSEQSDLSRGSVPSPIGRLYLAADDDGLVEVLFEEQLPARWPEGVERETSHPILRLAARELEAYFAGDLEAFTTPVAPRGTAFQREVWRALRTIPFGERRAYRDVARAIGRGGAERAVGAANGRNRVGIIIPCHRVVGANGALTGYAGGLHRKRWLLEHEREAAQRRVG